MGAVESKRRRSKWGN